MAETISYTIVLPCYNPQPHWAERVVVGYNDVTALIGIAPSVILVNDGSVQHIGKEDISLLEQSIACFKYISYTENRGKGYALRQGVAQANTPYIIYTDIDFPYTADSLAAVFNSLYKDGYDVAIGIKNDSYYEHVPVARRFISKALRQMIGLLLDIPITDTQCGLKGFKNEISPEFLSIDIDRYLFDLEFIRKTSSKRYRLKAIPVILNSNVVFRSMNYKLLLPEIINLFKISFRRK